MWVFLGLRRCPSSSSRVRSRPATLGQMPLFRIVGLLALAIPAFATSASLTAPHVRVELIKENQTTQPGRDFAVGLLFHLEKGWHIYWRNPGDSGSPPQVQWKLPRGLHAGDIQWPYPQRIRVGPLMNYGYEDEVLLITPMRAASKLPSGPAKIDAAVKWVICQEVCIAGKGDLSLALPVASAIPAPSPFHDLFVKTRRHLPRALPAAWKLTAVSLPDALVLTGRSPRSISTAEFFPTESLIIENAVPQIFKNSSPTQFSLRMKKSEQLSKPVPRLMGILVNDGRAYEVAIPVISRAR